MAALSPVIPQAGTPIGGSPLTAEDLARRQAAITAAQGGPTQYGGSALTTPVVPVAPTAPTPAAPVTGNINDLPLLQRQSMLTSMTPEQRQAAVNPVAAPVVPAAPAKNYTQAELNNMPLLQRQAAIDAMSPQQQTALAGPGPTYGGSQLTQVPEAVRQAQVNYAQGGPNLYGGLGITPVGAAYKKAFTPTQAQLAAMQANPALAQRYVNAAAAGSQQVTAAEQAHEAAIQAAMAKRAAGMSDNSYTPLLGMIPGVGAAMTINNMATGKGGNPMSLLGPAMSLFF